MKKNILFIFLIFFSGCVENSQSQSIELQNKKIADLKKDRPIKKSYVKKYNLAFYKKTIKELKYDEAQILKSINLDIEKYKKNQIPKNNTYSNIYMIYKSINILKIRNKKKNPNHFQYDFPNFYKENGFLKFKKKKIIFDIDEIIEVLENQLEGESSIEKIKIEEKINFLRNVKKEFLEKTIEILKKLENNQKRSLSIFDIRDTIEILEKINNKQSFDLFDDIQKSIKTLKKVKKIEQRKKTLKDKKYSKQVLTKIKKDDKNTINSINKDEEEKEKISSDSTKLKILREKILKLQREEAELIKKEKKSQNNSNNYIPEIDPSFFGKGTYYKVSKSNKVFKKLQENSIKIESNEYISLNSINELKNLRGIRTYVLFPKNIDSTTSNIETYNRYATVLEYIQEELNEITVQDTNETNINDKSDIKTQKNRFILFYKKEYSKKLIVDNYNYKTSHEILDIFRNKIKSDIFYNDGPFFITMNKNIFNTKEGFEFIYIDLSGFKDSIIKEVINSYRAKLEESGLSDVAILERFRLSCLSFITTFNANIHFFTELQAKD